jgi:hypothetical protein
MMGFIDWINGLGNIKWKSLSYITDYYYGNRKDISPHGKNNELTLSVWDQKKAALRRFACEFRDNYVESSSLLTKVYRMVRGTD